MEDRIANALGIAAQLRVPKPQRLDAARLQEFLALFVMLLLFRKTVLATINKREQKIIEWSKSAWADQPD